VNVIDDETGISLKTQELTALFLAVRLFCSFVMEFDLHTLLDSATFIYMIRLKLRPTYMEDKDNFPIYYVVKLPNSLFLFLSLSSYLRFNGSSRLIIFLKECGLFC